MSRRILRGPLAVLQKLAASVDAYAGCPIAGRNPETGKPNGGQPTVTMGRIVVHPDDTKLAASVARAVLVIRADRNKAETDGVLDAIAAKLDAARTTDEKAIAKDVGKEEDWDPVFDDPKEGVPK